MAVVTDMSPLRDPMRRAREVAEELTMAGDGTPLFQVRAWATDLFPSSFLPSAHPLYFFSCTAGAGRWRGQKGPGVLF